MAEADVKDGAKVTDDERAPVERSTTVTLIDPVKFGEETIKVLTWRKPTGMDIMQHGHPVKFNWTVDPPEITFDERKMANMMAALYAQPPSMIGMLSANDWTTAAVAIMGFFTPDLRQL